LALVAASNVMTEQELIEHVRRKSVGKHTPRIAEIMADLAQISPFKFMRNHTLQPFVEGISNSFTNYRLDEEYRCPSSCKRFFPARHEKMRFCIKCTSDDLRRLGRSFWRRSHQIPGVCWCKRHEIPLVTCFTNGASDQPHHLATADIATCIDEPFPSKESIEGRYLTIVAQLLNQSHAIPTIELCRWLETKAIKKNFKCGSINVGCKYLSDAILDQCSSSWCQNLFQDFSQKQLGEYFPKIDDFWRNIGNSATTYALAFATLLDDPV